MPTLPFQEYGRSLRPWLTDRDNVALPLRRRQRNRSLRRRAAEESLAAVGLTGASGRYPWQLSGGMQQRVALARALACDPVCLRTGVSRLVRGRTAPAGEPTESAGEPGGPAGEPGGTGKAAAAGPGHSSVRGDQP